jgi:hypothetical protein
MSCAISYFKDALKGIVQEEERRRNEHKRPKKAHVQEEEHRHHRCLACINKIDKYF